MIPAAAVVVVAVVVVESWIVGPCSVGEGGMAGGVFGDGGEVAVVVAVVGSVGAVAAVWNAVRIASATPWTPNDLPRRCWNLKCGIVSEFFVSILTVMLMMIELPHIGIQIG